jgi:hypothetical protein
LLYVLSHRLPASKYWNLSALYTAKRKAEYGAPEIIFLFANHNPRASKLAAILNSADFSKLAAEDGKLFDLRFYAASFAGYAMHSANMKTLKDFLSMVNEAVN